MLAMQTPSTSDPLSVRSAGDFETAVARSLEPCLKVARVVLSDPGEAEDAVQEAVLKAWRHLEQLRDDAHMLPWLLGIVANECRMTRRRRWWKVARLADPPRSAHAGDVEDIEGRELRRAIRGLPHDLRMVIALRYYLDLPLDEVALTVGIPLGTAKSRLFRAASRLRRELEKTEGWAA